MGEKQFGRSKRKPKNKRYRDGQVAFFNKLKRVRQSSGRRAAREYRRVFGPAGPRNRLRAVERR